MVVVLIIGRRNGARAHLHSSRWISTIVQFTDYFTLTSNLTTFHVVAIYAVLPGTRPRNVQRFRFAGNSNNSKFTYFIAKPDTYIVLNFTVLFPLIQITQSY